MTSARDAFAALHVPGRPLLLPNAWDVLTAVAFAADGHAAVGTTSLGVTAAAGLPDGARQGADQTVALARAAAAALPVPLTVDLEDGYSDDPGRVADLAAEIADTGAVGVNLEDAARTLDAHARVVASVRARVPSLFVNARTDVFWSGSRDLAEALRRCSAYRDAGADCVFVPGLADPSGLARVVAAGAPVNALWEPGARLADAGVARVSTGSALYRHALASARAAAAAFRAGAAPSTAPVGYAWTQDLLRASNPQPGRVRA